MTRELMLLLIAIDTIGVMLAVAIFFFAQNKMLAVAPLIGSTVFMGLAIIAARRRQGPPR